MSDATLRTITVDYTIEFARVLRGSSPAAAFSFLSGSGADPTGRSRLAFARYKGEAEKAVAANFHRLLEWPGTSVSADLRFFQTGGRINETEAAVRRLKPDAVVTVDSPGFCLRLAHHLRGSGIPVIHYVAPQLWAWGPFRARKLKKRVDHIMALLPFEVPFFAKYGVACTYVGHPAIDAGAGQGDGKAFRLRHGIAHDRHTRGTVAVRSGEGAST